MTATTTRTPPREIRIAAGDLAYLLAIARVYLARTRPHICARCGHLFHLPSLENGRHCARCGITQSEAMS